MDLISKEKLEVFFIQETILPTQKNFITKYFKLLYKARHTNYGTHGRAEIFIHGTIPHQKLTHKTPLTAIAARIDIGRDVTIVSFYNSRSHVISEKLLPTFFQQLPKPVKLRGVFNSYD